MGFGETGGGLSKIVHTATGTSVFQGLAQTNVTCNVVKGHCYVPEMKAWSPAIQTLLSCATLALTIRCMYTVKLARPVAIEAAQWPGRQDGFSFLSSIQWRPGA